MVKSVGEVAIVIGADLGPMNRELKRAEGGLKGFERSALSMGSILGSAMGRITLGVGAAATAMVALTKSSMTNIDALSKQARAAGVSVSAFQAMSMVANEAGVETDALSKMVVKLQDNIVQLGKGAGAQVAAFQSLGLSMSDLAGLSADEQFAKVAEAISRISDPAQRTAAALDAFGKSGAAALNMVDGYAGAVSEAARFQEQLGIAISDTDAQNIEKANDAVGRAWMAFEGLGTRLAVLASGPLTAAAEGFVTLASSILGVQAASTQLQNYMTILDEFGKTEPIAAMVGSWTEFQEVVKRPDAMEAIAELGAGYDALYETVNRATSGMAGDINDLTAVSESLGEGIRMLSDRAEGLSLQLRNAINEGRVEDAARLKAELQATVEQLTLSLEGAQRLSGVDMSGAIGWAEQLAESFGRVAAAAAAAANAAAMIPGMDVGTPLSGDVSGLMPPSVGGVTSSPRPKSAPNDLDFGLPEAGKGGGKGGGGGGVADKFARRLEVIVAALQTEREVIDAWYQESLALLQQATDAELEALGGKHEAMERLEEEHQRRLQSIREMGNQWSLESALSGGAEILNAMGTTNKKALKLAGIFSAAQALISTYEGAAKELKKGTLGFASAAAVIAKGLGFVAAIRSASGGGGGGGGRGGGGAAAAPQAPVQTMNFTVQNDPFGYGERFARSLAEQMNAARRNGSQIVATVTST